MRTPLTVAVVQPDCTPGEIGSNAASHAAAITAAAARLVAFPELSLTGYDLDATPVAVDDAAFDPIVEACAIHGSVALVGAPVRVDGAAHIATLVVAGEGVSLGYRKSFLGEAEETVFSPGDGPRAIVVAGWRVGLGICKDTRIPTHIDGTLALDVDLYVAGLVHHPHEVGELDDRAARIVELGRIPVAFASAAGRVGPSFPIGAGHSGIWGTDGTVLARCDDRPGSLARAVLHDGPHRLTTDPPDHLTT